MLKDLNAPDFGDPPQEFPKEAVLAKLGKLHRTIALLMDTPEFRVVWSSPPPSEGEYQNLPDKEGMGKTAFQSDGKGRDPIAQDVPKDSLGNPTQVIKDITTNPNRKSVSSLQRGSEAWDRSGKRSPSMSPIKKGAH